MQYRVGAAAVERDERPGEAHVDQVRRTSNIAVRSDQPAMFFGTISLSRICKAPPRSPTTRCAAAPAVRHRSASNDSCSSLTTAGLRRPASRIEDTVTPSCAPVSIAGSCSPARSRDGSGLALLGQGFFEAVTTRRDQREFRAHEECAKLISKNASNTADSTSISGPALTRVGMAAHFDQPVTVDPKCLSI